MASEMVVYSAANWLERVWASALGLMYGQAVSGVMGLEVVWHLCARVIWL